MGKKSKRNANRKVRKVKKITYFDYTLLFIIIFLACFGLVMLYSASSYTASIKLGDAAYYVKRQLIFFILGFLAMTICSLIDYHVWEKLSIPIYLLSFLLCTIVLLPGVGNSKNGSARWIQVGSITFQPSEMAKIAVILFLAMIFARTSQKKLDDWHAVGRIGLTLLPIAGVIAYSNLSTAIIVAAIAVCMLFVVDNNRKHILAIVALGVLGIFAFITFAGYRSQRVGDWLSIWKNETTSATDTTFQTFQGLYAIGSGGLFGKGLGESLQKKIVPESLNDMIFTIICEELGLFGGVCVILLYGLMLWRMLVIANNAKDKFGALIVVGVMSHIAIQVVLNIAVVTNLMPNTGVTLPFISYGGTSLLLMMFELGLVLSVSKGIVLRQMDNGENND